MAKKTNIGKKSKAGRKKIQLDYKLIENLSMLQCTQQEIASALNVNVKTLQTNPQFMDIYKKGLDGGKMSLRRMQFKLADKNATMGIWLGKQYLGQRDEKEIISRVELPDDIDNLSDEQVNELYDKIRKQND